MTAIEKLSTKRIPFANLLGIEFVSAEPSGVVAKMVVREDLCTTNGAVHGGALMAFADTIGAASTIVNLPEGSGGTTTLESKTNFLRGAGIGTTLIARATVIHLGRRTHVWTTKIETEDGKAVAVVTQTQMIL